MDQIRTSSAHEIGAYRRTCARLAALALAAAILALAVCDAIAASYPVKTVSLIVAFPAGGRTDLTGRLIAQHLQKHLGTSVIIVNKAGAGGVLGAKEAAQAQPDGYTLGFFSSAIVTAQYTVTTPTDLKDYAAISIVNIDPAALAVKYDSPWKTLADVVQYGRRNPGKLQIGMIPGASAQIFAGGFTKAAHIQGIYVPFKGDSDGAVALAGGHIEAHVAVPVSYKTLADAKKVRVLGIAAESRSPLYKDIPTFRENGVDLVIGSFHGVFAPKGTPAEVLATLTAALEKTMKEPDLTEQMTAAGLGIAYLSQRDTATFLAQQDATYKTLIEDLGMQAVPQKK
jgi:tripartite-type tricarboxylate transporter receptor subunit TctC